MKELEKKQIKEEELENATGGAIIVVHDENPMQDLELRRETPGILIGHYIGDKMPGKAMDSGVSDPKL